MSQEILNLEPKRVWYYFNEICKIPRGSGNLEGIRSYLIKFADEHKLEHVTDKIGNIVIKKLPSDEGLTGKPLILQGHMDMVCASAPGSRHDFKKDPIKPIIRDGWVVAGGTTLGADNGVAIASSLAILESKDIKHGPLECLFTVDEETVMAGALNIDPEIIRGRTLLNLDMEDEGVLYVGSAGTFSVITTFPVEKEPFSSGFEGVRLELTGFKGGHSGLDIHRKRANAIKVLVSLLSNLEGEYSIRLAGLNAGEVFNSIPATAFAELAIERGKAEEFNGALMALFEDIKKEFRSSDPDISLKVGSSNASEVLTEKTSDKIIFVLKNGPDGIKKMSKNIEGLVESSLNFGIARIEGNLCRLEISGRSFSPSHQEEMKREVYAFGDLMGAKTELYVEYCGWEPKLDSEILKIAERSYKTLFDKGPKITAVHCGLECGIIESRVHGLDMISFGPQLDDVHSVNERLSIESTRNFWKLLVRIIEEFGICPPANV